MLLFFCVCVVFFFKHFCRHWRILLLISVLYLFIKASCAFSHPLILTRLNKWQYIPLWNSQDFRYSPSFLPYFPSFKTHSTSERYWWIDLENEACFIHWEHIFCINLRTQDHKVVCPMPSCLSQSIFLVSIRAQRLSWGVRVKFHPCLAFCMYSCTILRTRALYNI